MTDDLPCRSLVELVTDYLEDALTDADRGRFEAHLTQCDACTTYVEQLQATVAVDGLRARALRGPVPELALGGEDARTWIGS